MYKPDAVLLPISIVSKILPLLLATSLVYNTRPNISITSKVPVLLRLVVAMLTLNVPLLGFG